MDRECKVFLIFKYESLQIIASQPVSAVEASRGYVHHSNGVFDEDDVTSALSSVASEGIDATSTRMNSAEDENEPTSTTPSDTKEDVVISTKMADESEEYDDEDIRELEREILQHNVKELERQLLQHNIEKVRPKLASEIAGKRLIK